MRGPRDLPAPNADEPRPPDAPRRKRVAGGASTVDEPQLDALGRADREDHGMPPKVTVPREPDTSE